MSAAEINTKTDLPTKDIPLSPASPVPVPVPVSIPSLSTLHYQIATCPRTHFEKRVLHTLLQIPCGSYTTYALLAAYLHTSPRAVGNALRRNPLAPAVPCHRVVATGRGIGGFKGRRGEDAREIGEKRGLLRREGVRFDKEGKVVGTPFEGFVDVGGEGWAAKDGKTG